jgi:transposase
MHLQSKRLLTFHTRFWRELALPIIKNSTKQLIFMHENAPIHKAKLVSDFLAENSILALEWPAQSPDINPIENMWAVLKARRARKKSTPTSKKCLIDEMTDLWSETSESFRHNLSNSLPKRLLEIIKNKGKQISY